MEKTELQDAIKQAMRDKDKVRLSTLRLVKNEIDIKEKDSGDGKPRRSTRRPAAPTRSARRR